MSFDLGQALLGALGGLGQGLEYEGKQQQAMADQAQTQQMNEQAWEMRQKWLQANSPAPTKTETVADPNNPGQNIVRNMEWTPADKDSGEPAQWLVTSTANDPNTMKLNEKSDEAAQRAQTAADRLKMQEDHNAAMEGLRAQMLALQADRLKDARDNGAKPEGAGHIVELPVNDKPGYTQAYVTDGKGGHVPMMVNGQPVIGRRTVPSAQERQEEADAAQAAQDKQDAETQANNPPGALSQIWNTMTGNSAANAPQASAGPPASMAGGGGQSPHGAVVRTGTRNGQRVAQYADGTIAPI